MTSLETLRKNLSAAVIAARKAGTPSSDGVHDIRVAIRRLDQGLKILRRELPSQPVSEIRGRLKILLRSAGEVRDRDIALKLVADLKLEAGAERTARLESDRDITSQALMRALEGDIDMTLEIDEPTGRAQLPELASSILPRQAAKFIQQGSRLSRKPTSKRRLHGLRRAAKRLRYSLEFFAECYGSSIEKKLARIRKLQSALGDIQDCVAAHRLLRDVGLTRGELRKLRQQESKRVAAFQELWPTLFRKSSAGKWKRYLKKHSYNEACPPQSKP